MMPFSKEQIKEITDQLECGFQVFFHKKTFELTFVPDTDIFSSIDIDDWDADFLKLEENPGEYQEIERMRSSDSFRVMAAFAEQVNDVTLQQALIHALNKRKPFQEFKYVINEADDVYRDAWFKFKEEQYIQWTEDQLNDYFELKTGFDE